MTIFESMRKYLRLVLDVVVYLAAVVGLVSAFGPNTELTVVWRWLLGYLLIGGYRYVIVLVAATVFAFPLYARIRQPKLFREYGFVASELCSS